MRITQSVSDPHYFVVPLDGAPFGKGTLDLGDVWFLMMDGAYSPLLMMVFEQHVMRCPKYGTLPICQDCHDGPCPASLMPGEGCPCTNLDCMCHGSCEILCEV